MTILGFDDNADGKAYMKYCDECASYPPMLVILDLIKSYDHICITDKDTYYRFGDADFSTYAPYSITIEAGAFVNVNKL